MTSKTVKSNDIMLVIYKKDQRMIQVLFPSNCIFMSKQKIEDREVYIKTIFLTDNFEPIKPT
jgi:hypothetical protein